MNGPARSAGRCGRPGTLLALAAIALAIAGCGGAGPPRAIDQPGLTSEGTGGTAGSARGRVGLRFPLPWPANGHY